MAAKTSPACGVFHHHHVRAACSQRYLRAVCSSVRACIASWYTGKMFLPTFCLKRLAIPAYKDHRSKKILKESADEDIGGPSAPALSVQIGEGLYIHWFV